jgi:outer membrane protein assembly factor BamB
MHPSLRVHHLLRLFALCAALASLGCSDDDEGDLGDEGDEGGGGGDDSGDGDDGGGVAPEPWQLFVDSTGGDLVAAAAAHPDGSLIAAGYFAGDFDLGGGDLPLAGSADAFVARFAADGAHLWSSRLVGGPGNDVALQLTVGPDGDILVAGYFEETVSIGDEEHVSQGDLDLFVARLSGEDGSPVWSRSFGSTGLDMVSGIAVVDEDVVATGRVSGDVDFGGGEVEGNQAGFVVRLARSDGRHVWSRLLAGTAVVHGDAIAASRAGNILVAGTFSETASFGGDDLVSADEIDTYLVELDGASGAHRWSMAFPGSRSQDVRDIVVDAEDGILLAGFFSTDVSFGGPKLETQAPDERGDGFVAKLSPTGVHVWSRQLGEPLTYDSMSSLDLLADGSIAVAGNQLDDQTFAALLDPATGDTLSSMRFTGPGSIDPLDITATAGGMVAVTGFFDGTVDLGTGPVTAVDQDAFISVRSF